MSDPVTYYGPGLAPTALVIRLLEPGEGGLASLSRPESEDVIVTGVRLVKEPAEGCAVREEDEPEKPKKGKKPARKKAGAAADEPEETAGESEEAAEEEAADPAEQTVDD